MLRIEGPVIWYRLEDKTPPVDGEFYVCVTDETEPHSLTFACWKDGRFVELDDEGDPAYALKILYWGEIDYPM